MDEQPKPPPLPKDAPERVQQDYAAGKPVVKLQCLTNTAWTSVDVGVSIDRENGSLFLDSEEFDLSDLINVQIFWWNE